jgi:integrase
MTENSMKRETGVKLRGGTYYFEIKAPADLKRAGLYSGPWACRISLDSSDVREANCKGARLRAEWLARFGSERQAIKDGTDPAQALTDLAASALARIKAGLAAQMRKDLEAFDTRTAGLTEDERQNWETALDAAHDLAQFTLNAGSRAEPEALELLASVSKVLRIDLSTLPAHARKACESEAQSARCQLLVLKSESVLDTSRIHPSRTAWLTRHALNLPVHAQAVSAPPPGGLDIVTLRQIKGLDIERGKLSLRQLFADFYQANRTEGRKWKDWEDRVKRDYGPVENVTIGVLGNLKAEELNLSHVGRVADRLRSDASANGLSSGTLDKKFNRLAAMLRWAKQKRILDDLTPPLTGVNVERESYKPFTVEELRALFECQAYRENTFSRASKFWIPLLGLYTGARVNELASIRLEHIAPDPLSGIDGITLSPEGRVTVKNDVSRRFVPLHPATVKAGFLTYVETLRSEGHVELFPCIGGAARDGKGKTGSRDFIELRRTVGVGTADDHGKGTQAFHSFRATLITAMQNNGVDSDVRRGIVGHAGRDVHERTYSKGQSPAKMKQDALSSVHFDFTHPTWIDTPRQQKARNRRRPAST